jgi:hypothetical protein
MTRPLSALRADLYEAHARLTETLTHLDHAHRRLRDNQPGYRTDTTPNPTASGVGVSQPERLHDQLTRDEAHRALNELDRHARLTYQSATVAWSTVLTWGLDTTRRTHRTEPGEEWCISCYRNDRRCEPSSERYKGRCRWCGSFHATYGQDPPLAIIVARHQGRRITEQMIQRALRNRARASA